MVQMVFLQGAMNHQKPWRRHRKMALSLSLWKLGSYGRCPEYLKLLAEENHTFFLRHYYFESINYCKTLGLTQPKRPFSRAEA